MSIDYVIISSDDNSTYKDFYPIVAKRWHDLGFKTYYINITDNDEIEETEFGVVHKMKKISFVPTSFQSQIVRLFSSTLIENKNILISDIDMLPISKSYFSEGVKELTTENVILYSGQPYTDTPYFPMCYVLSNSNTLRNLLRLKNFDFESFCNYLLRTYGIKWNCDEHFLYDELSRNGKNLIIKKRDFSNRIDRNKWEYEEQKFSENYYVDSHLPRPYSTHKDIIDKLCNIIEKKL